MKTLKEKQLGSLTIAILEFKEWSPTAYWNGVDGFYAVGSFTRGSANLHKGKATIIMNKNTIAFTQTYEDAKVLFDLHAPEPIKDPIDKKIDEISIQHGDIKNKILNQLDNYEWDTNQLRTDEALKNIELHIIEAQEIGIVDWGRKNLLAYLTIGKLVHNIISEQG